MINEKTGKNYFQILSMKTGFMLVKVIKYKVLSLWVTGRHNKILSRDRLMWIN
jgi:hypothetical protein